MLTHKPSFINILRGQLRQSSCHGSRTQSTARPKSRILFKHGPDLSLDLVVYRGIEDDHSTQEIRASDWKISTNCALNVPRPDALCSRKSGGQDGVALSVRRASRRERSTKKESHKVVALALGCGKRPKLHLPREVSKAIRRLRLMNNVTWQKNPHFQASCRDDFQTAGPTVV